MTANDTGHESDDLVEELRSIERDLFSRLGIHFRCLYLASLSCSLQCTVQTYRNVGGYI